jgi:uncharacterized protein (AIM24 family)
VNRRYREVSEDKLQLVAVLLGNGLNAWINTGAWWALEIAVFYQGDFTTGFTKDVVSNVAVLAVGGLDGVDIDFTNVEISAF